MRTNGAASTVISAITARAQLGKIMQRATTSNERFVVDRGGKPAVVIMSINDYIDTFAPTPGWLEAIHAENKTLGLDKISMARINAEVAAARAARRPGRVLTKRGK